MSKDKKWHYYAFSFFHVELGVQKHGSIYMGYDDQVVNMKRIKEAKDMTPMPKDAVLLSCCYLGCMTEKEFTGES